MKEGTAFEKNQKDYHLAKEQETNENAFEIREIIPLPSHCAHGITDCGKIDDMKFESSDFQQFQIIDKKEMKEIQKSASSYNNFNSQIFKSSSNFGDIEKKQKMGFMQKVFQIGQGLKNQTPDIESQDGIEQRSEMERFG